jgi:hypothetical protein
MPSESTKKIAINLELSQILECMTLLHASLAALTDSVEDLYLCSDMPAATHSRDVTLDLISRIKR